MTSHQTNLAWDTLLDLGEDDSGPMHWRLARALRSAVRDGRLPVGAALPPSRDLAAELGCSRWVVTEAYEQLVAEGYLESRVGSGTRVRRVGDVGAPAGGGERARATDEQATLEEPTFRQPAIDLAPGLPDLRHFPLSSWLSAYRLAAASLPYPELSYPDPAGHPRLRAMLAAYLARVRGAAASPADVTVTSGVTDGVTRICRALRERGVAAIAVEDPGWGRLASAARVAGLATIPIPVDDDGLDVDTLAAAAGAAPAVGAVVISPAHQFPSGTVLAPRRRAALLEWARRRGGLVIEDDYDAEFRYDRRPVATLQGSDPDRVALLGSLSKTLSPALGIGWMVTPPWLTPLVRGVEVRPAAPPLLDQLAFAEFLSSGGYDRHMRAARKRYRARRDALVTALARRLPEIRVSGAAAGLHLLAHVEPGTDTRLVAARADRLGVHIASIEQYRVANDEAACSLVLGYGNLGDGEVERAVELLARALES